MLFKWKENSKVNLLFFGNYVVDARLKNCDMNLNEVDVDTNFKAVSNLKGL